MQWITDHPYQVFFYILGALLAIFSTDIRSLIGTQFVSCRKSRLQLRYVKEVKLFEERLKFREDHSALIMDCVTNIAGCLLLFGCVVFILTIYVLVNDFLTQSRVARSVSLVLVNLLSILIVVTTIQMIATVAAVEYKTWFVAQKIKLITTRSQLVLYKVDVDGLEKKNKISPYTFINASIQDSDMRKPIQQTSDQ